MTRPFAATLTLAAVAALLALQPVPAAAGCWQVCSGSLGPKTPTTGGCLGQTVCHADDRKAQANCAAAAGRANRAGLIRGACEKRS